MTELSLTAHVLLAGAALGAGFVDAIAGGGGTITLPALLAAGLPPHLALGTNKGQSVFGSGTAMLRFRRARLLDGKQARVTFPLALLGSLAGAQVVLFLSPDALRPVVIGLLLVAAAFLTFHRPPRPGESRVAASRPALVAGAIALLVGAYDGFFGPGTGTFLIAAFVAFLGRPMDRASADAKVVNFGSNLAAVSMFAAHGVVVWSVALPMAVCQAAGAWLGAHATVRGGEKLVRPMVLVVVALLVAKLIRDLVVSR